MSYKAEVIADSTGTWAGNSLRFATASEAQAYVRDLYSRWSAVRDTRVIASIDDVTHGWDANKGAVPCNDS